MKKLTFIYTNPEFKSLLYTPVMSEVFDGRPDVEIDFSLDDSLAKETRKNGMIPTKGVIRRLYNLVENCVLGGAECVVVGCTAINLATFQLKTITSVPLIGLDEPLVDKLYKGGWKKIALVSHSEVHAKMTGRLLEKKIPDVQLNMVAVPEAATAFAHKNMDDYEKHIVSASRKIENSVDVLAFPHIACDQFRITDLHKPVFYVGQTLIDEVLKVLVLPAKN